MVKDRSLVALDLVAVDLQQTLTFPLAPLAAT